MDFTRFSSIDSISATWVAAHSGAGFHEAMALVSAAHSQALLWFYAGLIAAYTGLRREYKWMAIALAAIPSGLILNVLLKEIFARMRPPLVAGMPVYDTYSFPSGHAAGATLVYGVLAAYLAWRFPRRGARALVFAGAALMVALVCISRLVLGVHYMSDVVAGVAWATIWVAAWVALLTPRTPRAA